MKALNNDNKTNTTAHLVSTITNELSHVFRHQESRKKSTTQSDRAFHDEHIDKHLKSSMEHTQKLSEHLKDNYPSEGKELNTIEAVMPMSHRDQTIKLAAKLGRGDK